MDNFLDFITKDIESKKTLYQEAPTKTKTNRKKLYEMMERAEEKYIDYQKNIYNYLIRNINQINFIKIMFNYIYIKKINTNNVFIIIILVI